MSGSRGLICLLILLLSFSLESDSFRVGSGIARRRIQVERLMDSVGNGDTEGGPEKPLPFSRDGPGHVDNLPMNLMNQSQRELIRVILGIAVLYLNFRVKVQEAYARVDSTGRDVDSTEGTEGSVTPDGIKSISAEDSGIRYVDLREGNTIPRDEETIFVTAKFMHKGLEVASERTNREGSFVQHSVDPEVFMQRVQEAVSVPSAIENAGALQGLMTMKLGGKRHVSLQMGEDGFPPFVPPYGTVIAELELKTASTV